MTTLDRYIARQFLFNLLMLFVVVCGLYVLLDLIINFDEFFQAAQEEEGATILQRAKGIAERLIGFYVPLVLTLFVYTAGLLPVGAAAFTLASLIRNRELVATLAGGISLYRVTVPLVLLTLAVNALMVADQELLLPNLAARIVEGHGYIRDTGKRVRLRFTPDTNGALYSASDFDPDTSTLSDVVILIRNEAEPGIYDRAVQRIVAQQGIWDEQRGGWDLVNAHVIRDQADLEGDATDLLARSAELIEFIPSDLDPTTILLRERDRYRQFLGIRQLAQLMDKPQLVDARDLQRLYHSRFSTVAANLLILLLGLSCFLLRAPEPLLTHAIKAAILCIPAWAGTFMMHQLPPEGLPPAALAWLPVAIYMPMAFYFMDSVET